MAGPFGFISTSSGSILGNLMSSIDSVRPHILGNIQGQTSPSGTSPGSLGSSLSSFTSILSTRPTIFKARMSNIQSAPTIMDKITALLTPPSVTSTPTAPSPPASSVIGKLSKQITGVPIPQPPTNIVTTPRNLTFH